MDIALFSPSSLFAQEDDSSTDEENAEAQQKFVERNHQFPGMELLIREFTFHQLNANLLWPGSFAFAEWLVQHKSWIEGKRIIELGSGTGGLAIFLWKLFQIDITTSDYDDSDIEENIAHNCKVNGVNPILPHIKQQFRPGKRPRLLVDESEENDELEEDIPAVQNDECLFEDLCKDVSFPKEDKASSKSDVGCWGLLEGLVLARVFHFLRDDLKSLVHAESTCKHWRCVSKFYKNLCIQADLSCVAPSCTDSVICCILSGYNKEKLTSLVLRDCTNITPRALEEVLQLLPSISSVDIRGCSQFDDLTFRFPNIIWVGGRLSQPRTRSLKHLNDKSSSVFKTSYGSLDEDSSCLRDYLESSSARDSANQLFRRSLYKRSKRSNCRSCKLSNLNVNKHVGNIQQLLYSL